LTNLPKKATIEKMIVLLGGNASSILFKHTKEQDMRSLKLLGMALIAALALGAMATTAFALVLQLPKEETARTFTGKADGATNPKFETVGGTFVECTSAPGTGTEEAKAKPLGLFHIEFKGCKGDKENKKVACNGLGDAAETILVLGTYHLWYDSLSPLGVATVFLLDEVHFECKFIFITLLFKVKGSVVCLDLEPTVSKKEHLFHCTQNKGVADEKIFWDESGIEQKAQLLQSENDGAFSESGELALGVVISTVNTFADNV
jgi:hypothetical protein